MIKKAETLVYLDPIPHVYINRETGEKYKSVTTVISSIEHEFDVDGVATSISKQSDLDPKKNPLYIGMSKDRIVNYWKEINDSANEYGTHIHLTSSVCNRHTMNSLNLRLRNQVRQTLCSHFSGI
jgi:hypothetical protein